MAINKVVHKGNVLIDLTEDSVSPETLAVGATAHDKSGEIIVGTFEGGGTDTSDATAAAADIMLNKTAYTASGKTTGTFTIDSELNTQEDLIEQISTLVATKATPPAAEPELQNKTITANGSYTADSGYDGLGTVTVNVSATQSAPTITVSSSGLITASADGKSSTKQLTTQAAKTVTPSTSSQTAVASGKYTTGTITVGAIPSDYVKPTTKKAAATYTPGTSNQTIASGTYLTGTQTIKGDSNLKAENIKSGVSIFGINGTAAGAEDLETELTQQEALISQLSNILDSKASGGGSAQTCTVTCTKSDFPDETAPGVPHVIHLMYMDRNGNIVNGAVDDSANLSGSDASNSYECIPGMFVAYITAPGIEDIGQCTCSENATMPFIDTLDGSCVIFTVTGDCSIEFMY